MGGGELMIFQLPERIHSLTTMVLDTMGWNVFRASAISHFM